MLYTKVLLLVAILGVVILASQCLKYLHLAARLERLLRGMIESNLRLRGRPATKENVDAELDACLASSEREEE